MTARRIQSVALMLATALAAGALAEVAAAPTIPVPPARRTQPQARPQQLRPSTPPTAPAAAPLPVIHLHVDAPPPSPPKRDWLTAVIAGIFSVAGSGLVLWAGFGNTSKLVAANLKAAQAHIHQKANEAELASIQTRLTEFYGPFLQRSQENFLLIAELRSRQPPDFRTLKALQNPQWKRKLSAVDRHLLEDIVVTGVTLRDLIRDKGGLADPALREHLARASTHFRLLSLANAGALSELGRFDRYVYPRELDGALITAIDQLEARARQLRSDPSASHGLMPQLQLRPEHQLPSWVVLDPATP